jgi:ATP-binding cassette subfamily B protein
MHESSAELARIPQRGKGANLKSLGYLWRYLRPQSGSLALSVVAILITSGATLSLGAGIKLLVDAGIHSRDSSMLNEAFWWLTGATLLMAGGVYARVTLVSRVGERAVAALRQDVFDHLLTLSPSFYDATHSGETLSRVMTDTTLLESILGTSVAIAVRNAFLTLGGLTMLLITSAQLTGYVLLAVPMVIVPIVLLGRYLRKASKLSQDRTAALSHHVEESLQGIRTLQAFTLERYASEQMHRTLQAGLEAAYERIRMRAAMGSLVITLVFGAVTAVMWVGGRAVIAGELSAGELTAFLFYAITVASAVGALSEMMADMQRASGATERLMELLRTAPTITAPASPTALPQPVRGHLRMEGVSFTYPTAGQPSLEDFSLEIQPGETVALVGPSGSGKSTVFQLLLRFYDPQQGCVTLDGIPLTQLDPKTIRHSMGMVFQETPLFSLSIEQNIALGDLDASPDAIHHAAEQAAALPFIEVLPDRMHTQVGERGMRLSGGERQRIAIARALLKNPPILLLDEATSALDASNEKRVQDALASLTRNRTTLIIAHRLATVQHVDRILVMEKGRIVGSGTHQELLLKSPLYAELAALQFTQAA